ncbi:MAG: 30S ribosomal protein S9 [Candidatus Micrarchaeota archaeon]
MTEKEKKAEKEAPEEKTKKAAKKKTTKAAKKKETIQEPKKEEKSVPEGPSPEQPNPLTPEPVEAMPEKKSSKKKKRAKKKAPKVFVVRGKRKESVARATIKAGRGIVRINSISLSAMNNKYVREIIREPLRYVGPEVDTVDISVNVYGGGLMGQAQASRTAIAKALAMYFEELKLKEKFISIDRSLMIEDTRRVESKKDCGPKARARYQKSYR